MHKYAGGHSHFSEETQDIEVYRRPSGGYVLLDMRTGEKRVVRHLAAARELAKLMADSGSSSVKHRYGRPRRKKAGQQRRLVRRRRVAKRSPHRWIQHALRHHKKGSLHRMLKIPLGQKIPLTTLRHAAKHGRTLLLRRRAQLALNMRRFRHPKKR